MGGQTRIKLKCPDCAALVDVTGIDAGRQVLCIKCERVITVPDPKKARRAKTRITRKVPRQEKPSPPPPEPEPPDLGDSSNLWGSELDDSGGSMKLTELELGAGGDDEMAEFKDEDGWIDWGKKRKKKGPDKSDS